MPISLIFWNFVSIHGLFDTLVSTCNHFDLKFFVISTNICSSPDVLPFISVLSAFFVPLSQLWVHCSNQ